MRTKTIDPVWAHTTTTKEVGSPTPTVTCKYCELAWKSKDPTRVHKHLSKCLCLPPHLEPEYRLFQASGTSSKTGEKRRRPVADSMDPEEQLRAEAACARWIYSAGLPLSTTDHPSFKSFIAQLRPAFQPPGRSALSNRLLDTEYTNLQSQVHASLSSTDRISLITDGWTNPRGDSIINYLASTRKHVFFLKSVSTQFDRHTGQYIADGLAKVIAEIGESKVISVTTDNAPNMKSSWKLLREKCPKLVTMGCCSHQLNLAVGEILKLPQVAAIWQPVLEVAKYFKQHAVATALVRSYAQPSAPFKAFQVPGQTRWQGKLYTLDAVLANLSAIQQAIMDSTLLSNKASLAEKEHYRRVMSHCLEPGFWLKARQLQSLLRPFLEVTIALESNSPKLSQCYSNFGWLMKQSCTSELVPRATIEPLLKTRFQKAWHPLMTIAYLADPAERKQHPIAVSSDQLNQIGLWLRTFWFEGNHQQAAHVWGQLQNLRANTGPFSDTFKWMAAETMDLIDWWDIWRADMPYLAELCQLSLSINPTTGAAERNWSAHGYIHSVKRNRLEEDKVQKLVFVYFNTRLSLAEKIPEEDLEEPLDIHDDQESYEPDYMQEGLQNPELDQTIIDAPSEMDVSPF